MGHSQNTCDTSAQCLRRLQTSPRSPLQYLCHSSNTIPYPIKPPHLFVMCVYGSHMSMQYGRILKSKLLLNCKLAGRSKGWLKGKQDKEPWAVELPWAASMQAICGWNLSERKTKAEPSKASTAAMTVKINL